jgi:hypothetical protein
MQKTSLRGLEVTGGDAPDILYYWQKSTTTTTISSRRLNFGKGNQAEG